MKTQIVPTEKDREEVNMNEKFSEQEIQKAISEGRDVAVFNMKAFNVSQRIKEAGD